MPNVETITKGMDSKQSSFTVYPHGARLEKLVMNGKTILNIAARGDGKPGTTHPCSPIFGPETTTKYGLPQHGPVRDMQLKIVDEDDHSLTLSGEISHGAYPSGLGILQKFSLTPDVFFIKTVHTNHGDSHVPVNFGEHCYWHTPHGWEGVTINGTDVTTLVQSNGIVKLKEQNTLFIPGQPTIHLEQKGLHYAVLWSYKNPSSGDYDQEYVCIEPVEGNPAEGYFGSKPSLIEPHAERLTMLRISLA